MPENDEQNLPDALENNARATINRSIAAGNTALADTRDALGDNLDALQEGASRYIDTSVENIERIAGKIMDGDFSAALSDALTTMKNSLGNTIEGVSAHADTNYDRASEIGGTYIDAQKLNLGETMKEESTLLSDIAAQLNSAGAALSGEASEIGAAPTTRGDEHTAQQYAASQEESSRKY